MYRQYQTIDNVPHEGTPTGNQFLKTYTLCIKDGRETLECTGKTNIHDYVQQDLEASKIENILKRVALGDLSALRQTEPQYVDSTTMPSSMMEVQNMIVKAKYEFEKMPEEVKQKFNYSAEEYVNEMGTKEFLQKMSGYIEKLDKIAAEKNHKEYEKKVKEGAKLNYDIAREQAILAGEETKA